MKKTLTYILVAVVVIVGGVFLFGGESTAPSPDNQMEEPSATSTENGDAMMEDDATSSPDSDAMEDDDSVSATQDNATVTYTDEGFSPQTVAVTPGGSVTFVNESSQGMWVASNVHPIHSDYDGTSLSDHCGDDSDAFDTCEDIPSGESWTFTFDQTGSWGYHNHTIPADAGVVVVE